MNIFDVTEGIICHQCNCQSRGSSGLAKAIFTKWPRANTYGRKRIPGSIDIIQVSPGLYVCKMYAQKSPALPSKSETAEQREEWFAECLRLLDKQKPTDQIYMPYKIGCASAGGSWEHYLAMINRYSITICVR
jgi:hypothetical protein